MPLIFVAPSLVGVEGTGEIIVLMYQDKGMSLKNFRDTFVCVKVVQCKRKETPLHLKSTLDY